MNLQWQAIQAETLKIKHANITWVSFIAFALAPLMGGVFMLILRSPEAMERASSLTLKAKAMNFGDDWHSYLSLLTQAVGVGGILVFGFVASWLFGREYTDGTAKDLLALPVNRAKIINAKFIIYVIWCFLLAIANLLIGFVIGKLTSVVTPVDFSLGALLYDYFFTTLLTVLPGIPVAFFALSGRGYLAPLGFVALILVFAQIVSAVGFGNYFPWAIPGLYSSTTGNYRDQLGLVNYSILACTSLLGYLATVFYWNVADHTK